ncbi:MAG: L-rhamnose/proton symporter RhaT, partial [Melioribacteraceae bacterium]
MIVLLGILYHAIGGFAAGSFYIPYNKIKNMAWEVYWLIGGTFSWVLMPWLLSLLTVPDLSALFASLTFAEMFWPYFFGALWGIGGLTFGMTMRFLGMSLGMAMALGLTAAFGTLVPPIYHGQLGDLLSKTSGLVTLGGV